MSEQTLQMIRHGDEQLIKVLSVTSKWVEVKIERSWWGEQSVK